MHTFLCMILRFYIACMALEHFILILICHYTLINQDIFFFLYHVLVYLYGKETLQYENISHALITISNSINILFKYLVDYFIYILGSYLLKDKILQNNLNYEY
jgi:hypothetical protein